jgi:predicted Zn-dependent protease
LATLLVHSQKRYTLAQFEALYAEKFPQRELPALAKMDPTEFSEVIQELAVRQARNGSTAAEFKACDRCATDLLVRLGYEAGGVTAYLERVQARLRGKQNAVLPDYPVYKARMQTITERLAELSAPGEGRSLADRFRRDCAIKLPASAQ